MQGHHLLVCKVDPVRLAKLADDIRIKKSVERLMLMVFGQIHVLDGGDQISLIRTCNVEVAGRPVEEGFTHATR